MTLMRSIDEFTDKLINEGEIHLSLKEYSKKLIESKILDIPFTIDFINISNYYRDSCINNSILVKYGIVNDENEIKDYLISHGYQENIDFEVENDRILIDARLFKLLLIDSKDSNEYIKWYLTIEDAYRNYTDGVNYINFEKRRSILSNMDMIKIDIEDLNRLDP